MPGFVNVNLVTNEQYKAC